MGVARDPLGPGLKLFVGPPPPRLLPLVVIFVLSYFVLGVPPFGGPWSLGFLLHAADSHVEILERGTQRLRQFSHVAHFGKSDASVFGTAGRSASASWLQS